MNRKTSAAYATIFAERHAETRAAARRALTAAARAYVAAVDGKDKEAFMTARANLIAAAASGDL